MFLIILKVKIGTRQEVMAVTVNGVGIILTMSKNPFLSLAIEAARAGEEVIRHYYNSNLKVSVKQDQTPVTVADIETEQKIKEVILGAYPDHGFYGEETGKTNLDAEYIWLIDPNHRFVRRNNHYP